MRGRPFLLLPFPHLHPTELTYPDLTNAATSWCLLPKPNWQTFPTGMLSDRYKREYLPALNAITSALIPPARIAIAQQQICELLRHNGTHQPALYESRLRWKLFGLETASYYVFFVTWKSQCWKLEVSNPSRNNEIFC